MAGLFYTVDLSRDERMARNPRLVDKFLVGFAGNIARTIGTRLTVNL